MISSNDLFLEEQEYLYSLEESLNSPIPEDVLPPPNIPDDNFNIELSRIMPSKTNVTLLATRIASLVADGKVDAVEAAIRLNAMMNMCKEALVYINSDVIDELDKAKGKLTKFACKVERAEVGTKYDYSANAEWRAFAQTEQEAAEQRKLIEERLKRIPEGKLQVDESTGETLQGPTKTSTTSFKVTLAK